MKIFIDRNIKTLSIYAQGDEIAKVTGSKHAESEFLIFKFKNVKLIRDNAVISQLPSSIRDAVIKTYEFPIRVTEYDGTSVVWSETKYPGVWSPSIDTILFARALRKQLPRWNYLRDFNSLLEIGCGSGFLTKYLLMKKRKSGASMRLAHLMDINIDAIKCSLDNLEEARCDTDILYSHNRVNSPLIINQKYDVVICNPPYIPRPRSLRNNPYEGLFLYKEIFNNAEIMLNNKSILLITFSSLSEDITIPLFKNKFRIKVIDQMRVPLKIPQVFSGLSKESRDWTNYLERRGTIEIDKTDQSGYRYWETIKVAECILKH